MEIKNLQHDDFNRHFHLSPTFKSSIKLGVRIYSRKTELLLDGVKRVISSTIRTKLQTPPKKLKTFIQEVSKPGFRITAYPIHTRDRKRIKVEIRSGRNKGKHSWKKAKICDTQHQAMNYIKYLKQWLFKK